MPGPVLLFRKTQTPAHDAVSQSLPGRGLSAHKPHRAAWRVRHCCPRRYVAARPAC